MVIDAPVKHKLNAQPEVAATGRSSIIDSMPTWLVMAMASPYIAGRSAHDAISRAHTLYKQFRFTSTIDILGEDAVDVDDCERSVRQYCQLIDLIAAQPLPCRTHAEQITVSFKPSMFSVEIPQDKQWNKALEDAYSRIESIVSYAQNKGICVTLEAEDNRWTDFHLDAYFSLINAGYTNLGTVLQSRLFRTKEDLSRFDERCRARMVIGIYNEPDRIALTEKSAMKDLAVRYSRELLSRGTYVELASHDTACVKNFIEQAVLPAKAPASKFELQFLLGVPRRELQLSLISGKVFTQMAERARMVEEREHLSRLALTGALVRLYLPYGAGDVAGPYCKRRLKANPNMVAYGIKNLFGIQ